MSKSQFDPSFFVSEVPWFPGAISFHAASLR